MLDPSTFHELVSGRRRGAGATVLRGLLRLAETPYGLYMRRRNRQFDRGRNVHRVKVPVVSVGNMTVGGTGKTPMVQWLARYFRDQELRVALISRGYGAEAGTRNDEALELELNLPDVPHLQNPDRVEAANVAIEELESQILVLDDAFQHRRLHRDLDIVLLDALEPFGYEHCLPRGLLREPHQSLARADVVALSRADLVEPARREEIRERVRSYAPQAAWLEVAHRPSRLRNADGEEHPPAQLTGKAIAAFCGIGNPDGFRRTLETCGYRIEAFRPFPDHHAYNRADVEQLRAWLDELPQVVAAVCTQKDLVKLGVSRLGSRPLWALTIEMEVLTGRDELLARLQPLCRNAAADAQPPGATG